MKCETSWTHWKYKSTLIILDRKPGRKRPLDYIGYGQKQSCDHCLEASEDMVTS